MGVDTQDVFSDAGIEGLPCHVPNISDEVFHLYGPFGNIGRKFWETEGIHHSTYKIPEVSLA